MRSLKAGKSPGVDNIPSELLKNGGEVKTTALTVICQKIWERKKCSKEWTQSLVIPLPKKGNLKQYQNYRPISLTFSQRITHYGMIGNFSLPTVSATGGRQALHHSWTRRTLVCGTNAKNSTAELLIVKWIQLLLVFSWGFQSPQRVINLDPAF